MKSTLSSKYIHDARSNEADFARLSSEAQNQASRLPPTELDLYTRGHRAKPRTRPHGAPGHPTQARCPQPPRQRVQTHTASIRSPACQHAQRLLGRNSPTATWSASSTAASSISPTASSLCATRTRPWPTSRSASPTAFHSCLRLHTGSTACNGALQERSQGSRALHVDAAPPISPKGDTRPSIKSDPRAVPWRQLRGFQTTSTCTWGLTDSSARLAHHSGVEDWETCHDGLRFERHGTYWSCRLEHGPGGGESARFESRCAFGFL